MPKFPKIAEPQYPHSPNNYCYCKSQRKFKDCCLYSVSRRVDANEPRILEVGGFHIYRPPREAYIAFDKKIELHLRSCFAPGTYTNRDDVDKIVKHVSAFCRERFAQLLPLLAGRDYVEFLLWQYDQTGALERLNKAGKLSGDALSGWTEFGRLYRRALKFMAERTTMLEPPETSAVAVHKLRTVWDEGTICAEELINFCGLSDQTVFSFPDSTKFVIYPPGSPRVYDHRIEDDRILGLEQRIMKDARLRKQVYESPLFEDDHETHAIELNDAFRSHVGVTYKEAIEMLWVLGERSAPHRQSSFPVFFIRKPDVVSRMAEVLEVPQAAVEKVLAGFSLTKEQLDAEKRDHWNPQFHYRLLRRGVLVLPHSSGTHLAWSKQLFDESFILLKSDIIYGHFPKEWRTPAVSKQLEVIKGQASKWFEKQVAKTLGKIQILGLSGREGIGTGQFGITIEPGELDFIGWSERDEALVVIECKMLQYAPEARVWRGHVEAFVQGKAGKNGKREDSYVAKLKKKAQWVSEHSEAVCKALVSEGIEIPCPPRAVLASFITYNPSATAYFFSDFPCISLCEFVSDYREQSRWPYAAGRYPAN